MNASSSARSSVAFAAGDGLAAAASVASRLLTEKSDRRVSVFCNPGSGRLSEAATESLEALLSLKDRYLRNFSLTVVMEREAEEAQLLSGQLDGARVKALAGKLFDPESVESFFVCGPESFARTVGGELEALGVAPSRIHYEGRGEQREGGASPVAVTTTVAGETQVSLVMDGRRRSFTMRTNDESILDAAARAGIELPFSCKAGVCSTCRTKLVRGKVDLAENYALEDWELEQGFILACQARARTPEIELTYDET